MRKSNNAIISGVCAGLSEKMGIDDPIWVRLVFVFCGLFWVYIVLYFLMDEPEGEEHG